MANKLTVNMIMPTTESTPLIRIVRIAPPRQRYTHGNVRLFCTNFLRLGLIVVVVLFLWPRDWVPWRHRDIRQESYQVWIPPSNVSYLELQQILLQTPSEERAREWSQYYTAGPHLAGKNLSQALWTKERWQEFGVPHVEIVAYDIYINYPLGHRLALLEEVSNAVVEAGAEKDEKQPAAGYTVTYECQLEEDELDNDATSRLSDRVPTFHGYSASGNVTAAYVYANFGTYRDFEDLVAAEVNLTGKIALVKYGRIFRGLKVKRAQELGMVGVVMYSDPQEDGEMTELNGYKAYPDGPARNPSSVQRGSTQFLSIAPGDPTTPGYPSLPGSPRQDPHGSIPSIPSLPISYQDALPLLMALNGHGPSSSDFNEFWRGGGLVHKGVKYDIGPSPPNVVLNLINEQEYVTTPLWNVIGIINGTLSSEVVILGNHRDAWIAGGAGDPNSGSAALNEVIRSFGVALRQGWKPRRTIVFASWDGEEYGLIGSTEWVEQYLPWLKVSTVAYLNVDVGAIGSTFESSASPLLNKAIYEATSLVPSPNQTVPGQTVRDTWDGTIRSLGSGSDFTAFQDFAGIPSVDLGFISDASSAVYHYHSNYDSFTWMNQYGDRNWTYHTTITKVWSLLAANLAETPIIGFSASDYATALASYLLDAVNKAEHQPYQSPFPSVTKHCHFERLEAAASELLDESKLLDADAAAVSTDIDAVPWWKWWRRAQLLQRMLAINTRYLYLERAFLYEPGLDGRSWFKHVVFAPGKWTGYSGATFPGLVEGIEEGNDTAIENWCHIIDLTIRNATTFLQDGIPH